MESNEWRLQGQESYLKGVKLIFRKYRPYPTKPSWDHDHCDFCGATFSLKEENALTEGYATTDEYHWICKHCFSDFFMEFGWQVIEGDEVHE